MLTRFHHTMDWARGVSNQEVSTAALSSGAHFIHLISAQIFAVWQSRYNCCAQLLLFYCNV
jgi:hypothetical protein